jgi:hypothetical protein
MVLSFFIEVKFILAFLFGWWTQNIHGLRDTFVEKGMNIEYQNFSPTWGKNLK